MLESVTRPEVAFIDERGEITNIFSDPINHVALISSTAGSVRGNHYHPEDIQYCFLLKGRYESYAKDIRIPKGEIERQVIEEGSLVLSPPMVAHAQVFLEDSLFLALTIDKRESQRFEEHTIKVKII